MQFVVSCWDGLLNLALEICSTCILPHCCACMIPSHDHRHSGILKCVLLRELFMLTLLWSNTVSIQISGEPSLPLVRGHPHWLRIPSPRLATTERSCLEDLLGVLKSTTPTSLTWRHGYGDLCTSIVLLCFLVSKRHRREEWKNIFSTPMSFVYCCFPYTLGKWKV